MSTKKYVSLSKLQTFLENLSNKFAALTHTHKLSEISDYVPITVDSALSPDSTNPVANKVLNEEFEAIATSMNALDLAIDGKADSSHAHAISEVTNLQTTLDTVNETIEQKSQVQLVTSSSSAVLSTLTIHKVTQEEYEQAIANGTLDENALYLTPDEEIDLSGYATTEQLATKADAIHSHDNLYYTESEVDALLASKSDASHNHDSAYDAKGAADEALASAKEYANSAANTVKNDLLNGAGAAYDTLKELGDLIGENQDAIEALESVASGKADAVHTHAIADVTNLQTTLDGKASSSHTHTVANITDLTATATELNYMDGVTSSVQTQLDGKAASSHTHAISDVANLQSALDAKAASSHSHDDVYYTETEVNTLLSGKSDTGHAHAISDVANLQTTLDAKASADHNHNSVYDAFGSADDALTTANTYTDNAVAQKTQVQIITWGADD